MTTEQTKLQGTSTGYGVKWHTAFLKILNLHMSIWGKQNSASKYIKSSSSTQNICLQNLNVLAWASGWLPLAYNRTTWVTCRFHLAEWPSCHIPKDIGAGLAKWYGWVMGCRPHPDTLGRWGAAAKPYSPRWPLLPVHSANSPMTPHGPLSPPLTYVRHFCSFVILLRDCMLWIQGYKDKNTMNGHLKSIQ